MIPWVLDDMDIGQDVLEVGPGPGLTTDVIRTRVQTLTAVEIDPTLAADLTDRLAGTNVTVVRADATSCDLPSDRFSGAVCFTMLHHLPSPAHQDLLLVEVRRLLEPGGVLAGTDSLDGPEFRDLHVDDVCVPIDPESFAERLTHAGYDDVRVETNDYALRFHARKPLSLTRRS